MGGGDDLPHEHHAARRGYLLLMLSVTPFHKKSNIKYLTNIKIML